MLRRFLLILLCAGWLAGTAAGYLALVRHEDVPGEAANPPRQWPALFPRNPKPYTLVMLAHPRCPCTQASIRDLALIMARAQGNVDAHVLFVVPAGFSAEWAQSDLWRSAEEIPGVQPHLDFGGEAARRIQARTSGTVVIYDRAGQLRFHGGITASRGHDGDNAGRSAVLALLNGSDGASGSPGGSPSGSLGGTFVFGCSLFSQKERP